MQRITNHPLAILVIVSAITLGLAFYTIFLPKLPSLPSITNNAPIPSITTSPNAKRTIVVATQRPDYTLSLADSKNLEKTFDFLKVWDKTYQGKDTAPLNSVLIFLNKNPQLTEQKDDKGNVVFSYSLMYERDAVVMTVFLPDLLLTGPAPSQFFGAAVTSIASKIGGTNKTIAQIPNNNLISGFFKVESIKAPAN